MSRRRHIQSPVTIGTVRGFQCFPPSPQNRVLAQPTPLHRPTSQLPPLAITTTPSLPSLPSLPVQSLPSLLSLPLLPSLSSLSSRPSLPPRHCCPCASAISIIDFVVAATSHPPLLDLNLRRLHAQPSLVDDFSQGRLLKPELDIATLLFTCLAAHQRSTPFDLRLPTRSLDPELL
ncbi:hypothetical protein E4U30_001399 [Claviceps sp. LM220 group G6]|nr:hypothetical protein E4U15_006088 [Claviceps sp. LM218 group G6]KAG6096625.1 hypothetical protein E4U30_001399 [Claviceps sp. LM220 group G6]